MKYQALLEFESLDPENTIVIVSPGNFDDMVEYPRACKSRGIDYILDPGQSLPMWDKNALIQAIDGCRILIVNDYELSLIISKTGLDKNALLEKAGMIISARTPSEALPEMMELPKSMHPWFVGVQFHPEFTSTPREGHPLFTAFVTAALAHKEAV